MAEVLSAGGRRLQVEDAALLGVAVIWGGNAVLIKYVLRSMSSVAFNGVRFVLAAVAIMIILVLSERDWWLPWRDWLPVAMLGLVGHSLYQYGFIEGLARTSASNASLLQSLVPLAVALWSGVLGLELLTRRVWVGVGLSLAGAALVIVTRGGGLSRPAAGDLIVALACLAMAAYTVYSRHLLERYSTLKLTAWAMAFGAVSLVAFCLPGMLRQDWGSLGVWEWGAEVESFSLSIVLAFLLYGWAIRRIGSARSAVYLSLNPIVAASLGWAWLGESWSPLQWLGALLAIGGVVYARWTNE